MCVCLREREGVEVYVFLRYVLVHVAVTHVLL